MDDKKAVANTFFLSLLIFGIIFFFFAYNFYDNDIVKYEQAYRGKINLWPPTDFEVKRWESEHTRLEIEQKQKEILLLKNNIPIPDNIDEKVIDHFSKYPDGHNPPKAKLNALLNDAYAKRSALYMWAALFTIVMSLFVASRKNKEIKDKYKRSDYV